MPGEFDLIRDCFSHPVHHSDLGVGDDGALFRVASGAQTVVSSDMLVEGNHFFPEVEPALLGWKAAAVNISDMAAMGAEPRWITLALSLPKADEAWVKALASGFRDCCEAYGVDWVGGDTTRGPLNLCATIIGEVPKGQAILRDGARTGDDIWVSGWPGMAALGLQCLLGKIELDQEWRELCIERLERPMPRVSLGCALRGIASAMLDVSDGLSGDLGHILERSGVGAVLQESALPMETLLTACKGDAVAAAKALLGGGDDYELLFCAPRTKRDEIEALSRKLPLPLTRIGWVAEQSGFWMQQQDGQCAPVTLHSYDHFQA